MLVPARKGTHIMTAILILNAVSGLLATIGIGGFLVWRGRSARPDVVVQPN